MSHLPDFETFSSLASDARLIPVYRRILGDSLTPVLAFHKLDDGGSACASEYGYSRGLPEWDQPRAATLAGLSLGLLGEAQFDQEAIHSLKPAYTRRERDAAAV